MYLEALIVVDILQENEETTIAGSKLQLDPY